MRWTASLLAIALLSSKAFAGAPYFTDDPEPTEFRHFEIYAFSNGTVTRDGTDGAAGLDFSYGATPDLQLTFAIPVAYDNPKNEASAVGLGNVELAAKYRFLHQSSFGMDVSFFPRLFLPSGSRAVGERHASVLLPIWLEKDWTGWSTFGGGGCVINRGGGSKDFCLAGWALTHQVTPKLQLGTEIFHQSADTKDGHPTTGLGAGLRYDLTEACHVLAYASRGIQNAAQTNQLSWYFSLLLTI
jgi:hypothetical protein